jgi:hypothetical protein
MRTFTVIVQIRVGPNTDDHLQSPDTIRDEVLSWLSNLGAEVVLVEVAEDSEDK